MFGDFIAKHRERLLGDCRDRLTQTTPKRDVAELMGGYERIIDEVINFLQKADATCDYATSLRERSLPEAHQQGARRRRDKFPSSQLVHDYGVMCDAITDLADALDVKVTTRDWQQMNLAIDDGIATALTGFDRAGPREAHQDLVKLLGFYAHEMRNSLSTALLAFEALQDCDLSASASTGRVLGRSLSRLSHFGMDMMAEVRLDAHKPLRRQEHRLTELLDDSIDLVHGPLAAPIDVHCEHDVALNVDRELAVSAISNLLQNASQHNPPDQRTELRVSITDEHVVIEVGDACGGLKVSIEELLQPFVQGEGSHKGKLGLGLSIVKRVMDVHQGKLDVRDVPGSGCIFILRFPQ